MSIRSILSFSTCMFLGASVALAKNYELEQVHNLYSYISMSDQVYDDFIALAQQDLKATDFEKPAVYHKSEKFIPLFKQFPELKNHISYVALGSLPTPVVRAAMLEAELGLACIYIKCDDATGGYDAHNQKMFGGNKVRKLEFVFGDVLAQGNPTVMTFGCVGSNHACATAVYAHELGLNAILLLKNQANSYVVRRNLLLDAQTGAELTFSSSSNVRSIVAAYKFYEHKRDHGLFPYVIPTGASCPLGALGYVNGMLELKEQIAQGLMPEPDRIYVAIGSAGTAAGMLLGIKIAGLKSRLICIATEPEEPGVFEGKVERLFNQANMLLHDADSNVALYTLTSDAFVVHMDSAGPNYAVFTPEAVNAIALLKRTEAIALDGVYTGKALAGMLDDLRKNPAFAHEVILFWNTFCSDDFAQQLATVDYKKTLPAWAHQYFENDVQELAYQ